MFLVKESVSVQDSRLKEAFAKVKEEFSEHLQAINENTNEIQSNYEYLCELDAKIEKLAERLDEVAMFVQHPSCAQKRNSFEVAPLTKNEREVFQAVYTLVNEKGQASYVEVGRRCALSEELVQSYVTNLIEKGVPISKKYMGKEVFLMLDPAFCELQAKENILQIDETISEKVSSD